MRRIRRIDLALFTGLFVGVIVFIKEFLFPGTHAILSILIGAAAALIGYLIGDRVLPGQRDE